MKRAVLRISTLTTVKLELAKRSSDTKRLLRPNLLNNRWSQWQTNDQRDSIEELRDELVDNQLQPDSSYSINEMMNTQAPLLWGHEMTDTLAFLRQILYSQSSSLKRILIRHQRTTRPAPYVPSFKAVRRNAKVLLYKAYPKSNRPRSWNSDLHITHLLGYSQQTDFNIPHSHTHTLPNEMEGNRKAAVAIRWLNARSKQRNDLIKYQYSIR
jgi:hypothetical protein